MIARTRRLQSRARRLAVLAAVLLLSAQLLGAIHCHPAALMRGVTSQAQLTVDNGLCAVCLFAFHSPTNPTSLPLPADPGFGSERFVPAPWAACPSRLDCIWRGRDPPGAA